MVVEVSSWRCDSVPLSWPIGAGCCRLLAALRTRDEPLTLSLTLTLTLALALALALALTLALAPD